MSNQRQLDLASDGQIQSCLKKNKLATGDGGGGGFCFFLHLIWATDCSRNLAVGKGGDGGFYFFLY